MLSTQLEGVLANKKIKKLFAPFCFFSNTFFRGFDNLFVLLFLIFFWYNFQFYGYLL